MDGGGLTGKVALVAGTVRELGEATSATLQKMGAKVSVAAGSETPNSVVDQLVHEGGQLDILVNIVDGLPLKLFSETHHTDVAAVMEATLTGTFVRSQWAGRQMLGGSGGTIVNLMGGANRTPESDVVGSTIRGGLVGMTKVLGTEWAGRGVRVIAVSVGLDPCTGNAVGSAKVANIVAYLCSSGASFITGSHVRAGQD